MFQVVIISLIRGAVPFLLWINPMIAIVASLLFDSVDSRVFLKFYSRKRSLYNIWDKIFDNWWYIFCLLYSLASFSSGIFIFLFSLFFLRIIGYFVFLFKKNEKVFIFFPAFFENFFIFFVVVSGFRLLRFLTDTPWIWISGTILILAKVLQEIVIHAYLARKKKWIDD